MPEKITEAWFDGFIKQCEELSVEPKALVSAMVKEAIPAGLFQPATKLVLKGGRPLKAVSASPAVAKAKSYLLWALGGGAAAGTAGGHYLGQNAGVSAVLDKFKDVNLRNFGAGAGLGVGAISGATSGLMADNEDPEDERSRGSRVLERALLGGLVGGASGYGAGMLGESELNRLLTAKT